MRTTLFTGIHIPAVGIVISTAVLMIFGEALPIALISNGVEILGQVALWSPLIVFLFQMWPIREAQKLYRKITVMENVVAPYP